MANAATSRTNLGLGTIATQNANAVAITGGSFSGLGMSSITDNQTGPLTADRGSLTAATQAGPTAQQIYNQAVGSGSGTIFNAVDGVRGVGIANANSTVNIVSGVSAYTYNNTVPIGQRSQTTALNGNAVCAANGSECWGINTITSDNPSLANTGVTAGTGKFLFNEFDLEITSPNTKGGNLFLGGTALPTNVTLDISAIGIAKLWGAGGQGTGSALYSNGISLESGCCAVGLSNLVSLNAGGSRPKFKMDSRSS